MACLLLVLSTSSVGCDGSAKRVEGVSLDVETTVEVLLEKYDSDKSGGLSVVELTTCPSIAEGFNTYDSDNDGEITAIELGQQFNRVFDPMFGLCSVSCHVTRKGRPVKQAQVVFEPLEALKDVIPSAYGTTDHSGLAKMSIDSTDLEGVAPAVTGLIRPGFYRIVITHPQLDIPEQYNSATTLGQEISMQTTDDTIKLSLDF